MFGLSLSARVFGSVADMLVAIYDHAGFGPIHKWVDDFLVISLPGVKWTKGKFNALTAAFGVPWSHAKTRALASVQCFIGFNWDLVNHMVVLPPEKQQKMQELAHHWQQMGLSYLEKEAASLYGKLVHVSCILPLIRPFLWSISVFAGSFETARVKWPPPPSVMADLSWVTFLLASLPNVQPLMSPDIVDIQWWGDASSLHSDNSGVVTVTNKGRSRSRATNHVLKQVYLLQVQQGIPLHTKYMSTHINIADALSRGDVASFLAGFPSVTTQASTVLPEHLIGKLIPW